METVAVLGRTLDVHHDAYPGSQAREGAGMGQYDRLHLVDPADDRFVLMIVKGDPRVAASPWVVALSRYARHHGAWGTLADPARNWLSVHATAAEALDSLRQLGAGSDAAAG